MSSPLIKQLVYANMMMMNEYLPGIMSVIYGNVSPGDAMREAHALRASPRLKGSQSDAFWDDIQSAAPFAVGAVQVKGQSRIEKEVEQGRKTMVEKIAAVFDGKVFHPTEPTALEPNTRVRITIETVPTDVDEAKSFVQTARSLNLDGPPDWSVNLDKYLYGLETQQVG